MHFQSIEQYTYLVEPRLSMDRIRYHLSVEKSCDTCNFLEIKDLNRWNERDREVGEKQCALKAN